MVGSRIELKAFPAEMQNLYEMLAFVREEAGKARFQPSFISKIELAVEEALVNIISYAYPNKTPESSIDIECWEMLRGGLKIVIRDQGIAYNPLLYKGGINPEAPLDSRELGGYGIFFIVNLMDEVNYQREESANILTLIKHLPNEINRI